MEWIACEDRLPDTGQHVICAANMGDGQWWFGCCRYDGHFPWAKVSMEDGSSSNGVEYWMPLPPPPNEATE